MTEWLLIIGMMVLTYGPRYIPFGLAGKVKFPPLIKQALNFVPIAVLTAIIAMTSLVKDNELAFSFDNHHLIAMLGSFIAALIFEKLYLTIFIGMVFYLIAKLNLISFIW